MEYHIKQFHNKPVREKRTGGKFREKFALKRYYDFCEAGGPRYYVRPNN